MSRGKSPPLPPESQKALAQGFSERLFQQLMAFQGVRRKRLHHEELADLIGKAMPSGSPPAVSTVGRWFRGSVPDLETILALAKVLRCDPGWLVFGDYTKAPGPDQSESDEPVQVRKS